MFTFDALAAMPYCQGKPVGSGRFKSIPEDFVVTEQVVLETPCSPCPENLWLQLEKRGQNTAWAAKALAKHFSRPISDIGYAGLKDRHAVTTQWFSIRLGDAERCDSFNVEGLRIVDHCFQDKKLQKGGLSHNTFQITLRDVSDVDALQSRFKALEVAGFANYFGPQRFGHSAGNLILVRRWQQRRYRPRNKTEAGLLIGALRSWLFNLQIAQRLEAGRSIDDSGFLLGSMRFDAPLELAELLSDYEQDFNWLCKRRSKLQKRRMLEKLSDASFSSEGDIVTVGFSLPPGSYATSALRDVVQLLSV